jgi:error-prone DNA polymerase
MYAELHAQSAFSFLEGASVPEEMAAVCAEKGIGAMALLDRDGLYGSPRFHYAMKKAGLKAHIGSEITFNRGIGSSGHRDNRRSVRGNRGDQITRSPDDPMSRLPLICASRTGYRNLCHLITRMKSRGPKDAPPEVIAANEEDLAQHAEGLICVTGGEYGVLACALENGGIEAAKREAERLIRIFGR